MHLPIPAKRALDKLGADIRDARRRRRIPTALMAERAGISRMTLNKIENGDPGVSMGNNMFDSSDGEAYAWNRPLWGLRTLYAYTTCKP